MHRRLVAAVLLAAVLSGPARAAEHPVAAEADPDWPCIQRKVPSLTPAAVWVGPAVDDIEEDWRADPQVAALVARLGQRRLPIEEAGAEIAAFARSVPEDRRNQRLTLLFAGLFETMNAERGEILEGIDRYARRQKQMADDIRSEISRLSEVRAEPEPDREALAAAEEALSWQTRIFDDRRKALAYICEVPRLVEQRLFALGRAIAGELED